MIEMMQTYLSFLLIILVFIYARQILLFRFGLSKLSKGSNTELLSITVVIAARNEEKNILHCLESLNQQSYPKDKLSIIIVDDHSTDRTEQLVRSFEKQCNFPLSVIPAPIKSNVKSPKLQALSEGIQHANSTIIAATDADCVVPPNWIQTLVSQFENNVGVVSGVTCYERDENISSLFWGMQYLDFISYTAVGAGAIGLGKVLLSNGSNMAFRKDVFIESDGFEKIKNVNGGIDSLLAQTIVKSGKWQARFSIDPNSNVSTKPVQTVRQAFYQRVRWVGQTAHYPPFMMFFMICTFIMFVGLSISLPLTFFYWTIIPWVVFIAKGIVDYLTMQRFTSLTGSADAMKYFIPSSIIHIPLILIATITGYFFSFQWKDRTMKKESV